jgi:hypothetical protein
MTHYTNTSNPVDFPKNEYYAYLESLRDSGVTNMWGAAPFLQYEFGISYEDAKNILVDWIKSYE